MRSFAIVTILLCIFAQARANDSVAELEAGGITLVKTDGIVMISEDLVISLGEIRVSYIFRNETKEDITTRIAFPVPEWDEDYDGDLNLDRESKNPMGFSVTIDGKPVKFKTEVKRRKDDGRKMVSVTHHWVQNFPVNHDLKVEHCYTPAYGQFFLPGANEYPDPEFETELEKSYCVGPRLMASVKKIPMLATAYTLSYILRSGANWKGPIRDFKLTILKDLAMRVSLCWPDIRKVSSTMFISRRKDYTPTDDLRILYLPAKR